MKRKTKTNASIAGGIAAGAGIGLVVTLIAAAILAFLLDRGTMEESMLQYAPFPILFLCTVFGGYVAAKRVGEKWLYICLMEGAIYFACLLAITALIFSGTYQRVGAGALSVILGSICVGLLGLVKKGSTKKVHKKYRSR